MFIEINNTIQDKIKLTRKRLIIKKYLQQKIQETLQETTKINKNTYYDEETLQIIQIKIINLETYQEKNFTL